MEEGDVDGGLGGAVEVVELGGRVKARVGEVDEVRGEGLTGAEDAAQVVEGVEPRLLEEGAEHGGDEVDGGDALVGEEADEVGGVLVSAGPGEDEASAGEKGPEELPDGDVEAEGSLLEDGVEGGEGVLLLHPEEAVDDAGVGVHGALGAAGGARGEDDVGEGVRPRERRERSGGLTRDGVPLGVEAEHLGGVLRQDGGQA
ncbi:hypothetical protein VZP55_34985 [Myxococcus faecalis]